MSLSNLQSDKNKENITKIKKIDFKKLSKQYFQSQKNNFTLTNYIQGNSDYKKFRISNISEKLLSYISINNQKYFRSNIFIKESNNKFLIPNGTNNTCSIYFFNSYNNIINEETLL